MESNISRDHIALEAMKVINSANVCVEQSIWNKIAVLFGKPKVITVRHVNPSISAKMAYEYADAMLAEREKTDE